MLATVFCKNVLRCEWGFRRRKPQILEHGFLLRVSISFPVVILCASPEKVREIILAADDMGKNSYPFLIGIFKIFMHSNPC